MLGSDSHPQLPVSHMTLKVYSLYSTVYCVASVYWILSFIFLHLIMSTKCLLVSLASGEKRRKAITLEMKYVEVKLKIIAQL